MRTIFCLIFLLFCAGAASASESNGATVKVFSALEAKSFSYSSKYWDISPEDMFEIGTKLHPYLKETLLTATYFDKNNIDLSGYKQQYFGFYDKNGEKNIHINFFCVMVSEEEMAKFDEHKKRFIKMENDVAQIKIVYGGGDCYFNLNYNMKKKGILWFAGKCPILIAVYG